MPVLKKNQIRFIGYRDSRNFDNDLATTIEDTPSRLYQGEKFIEKKKLDYQKSNELAAEFFNPNITFNTTRSTGSDGNRSNLEPKHDVMNINNYFRYITTTNVN